MKTQGLVPASLTGIFSAVLLALLTRNALDHVALYDELLHFHAARGLLHQGHLVIADGLYLRASMFTHLVALSMAQFGETMVAARLPALLAGVTLVFAVSFWLTRRAGWIAGVSAGTLLCVLPATIQLSVFARFYTWHALVLFALAMLVYAVTQLRRGWLPALAGAVGIAALLALAWHLQESTAIAAGAIAAGAAAVIVFDHWVVVRALLQRRPLLVAMVVLAAFAAGIAALVLLGFIDRLNTGPLWAAGNAARPQFYIQAFAVELPLLWPLTLVAVLYALHVQPRLALFCMVIFATGLAVHSLAAAKAVRYVYYLMPFFCVVWGCAVRGMVDQLATLTRSLSRRLALALPLLLAMSVAVASQEGQRTLRLLAGKTWSVEEMGYQGEADWNSLLPALRPLAMAADRVITSNSMKALYYLGRYDYELNASIVRETVSGAEFGVDARTGRQAIGTAESVAKVLQLPGMALVVLEQKKLGLDAGVSAAALAMVASHCGVVVLPPDSGVQAWHCP